jgi:hypothetical protein
MNRKMVHIRWIDSNYSAGWEFLPKEAPKTTIVESVGFVLFENDEAITLTGNYSQAFDETPEQANGVMTIPKCCVEGITSVSRPVCG